MAAGKTVCYNCNILWDAANREHINPGTNNNPAYLYFRSVELLIHYTIMWMDLALFQINCNCCSHDSREHQMCWVELCLVWTLNSINIGLHNMYDDEFIVTTLVWTFVRCTASVNSTTPESKCLRHCVRLLVYSIETIVWVLYDCLYNTALKGTVLSS